MGALHLPSLSVATETTTDTVRVADLRRVDYDRGAVVLGTDDRTWRLPTTDPPTDLLATLADRGTRRGSDASRTDDGLHTNDRTLSEEEGDGGAETPGTQLGSPDGDVRHDRTATRRSAFVTTALAVGYTVVGAALGRELPRSLHPVSLDAPTPDTPETGTPSTGDFEFQRTGETTVQIRYTGPRVPETSLGYVVLYKRENYLVGRWSLPLEPGDTTEVGPVGPGERLRVQWHPGPGRGANRVVGSFTVPEGSTGSDGAERTDDDQGGETQ